MDRKTFTIVMGVALIAGFFLPMLSSGGSALDMVKSNVGDWQKYLWLIIPICGILLILGELNTRYSSSRGLLTWLPLITLLYFLILAPLINGVEFGSIFKSLGRGWGAGM